jgi:hypothetical protein
MIRKLAVWIAALTMGMLMMAVVLAGAAKAQDKANPGVEREVTVDGGAAPRAGFDAGDPGLREVGAALKVGV